MKTRFTAIVLGLSLATSTVAIAQDAMVAGEVRKIDSGANKITLKHGPIKSLGMDEGMTMVFRVKDPTMLRKIKTGDKVKFAAERGSEGIVVTKIEKSK